MKYKKNRKFLLFIIRFIADVCGYVYKKITSKEQKHKWALNAHEKKCLIALKSLQLWKKIEETFSNDWHTYKSILSLFIYY